jgi:hypothetical protein
MLLLEPEKKLFIEFVEKQEDNCYLLKTDDKLFYIPSRSNDLFEIINIIWLNEKDICLKYENKEYGLWIAYLRYNVGIDKYEITNKGFVNGVIEYCNCCCKLKINYDLIDINNDKVVKLF